MQELKERPSAELARTLESAKRYAQKSKADNTRRAYLSDWNDFTTYCDSHGLPVAPSTPEAVILYLTWLADSGAKYSTLKRRVASIRQLHKLNGMASPITDPVKEILKGIKNENGSAPDQKKPLLMQEIVDLVKATSLDLKGQRDRTMILIGFAGFMRRAELCSLKRER